jgi:hypothetical protein
LRLRIIKLPLPSFKRKVKYKNPDKVIYLRCMVQSILDIIGALRELRLKLETLQIKFLERTTLSPCFEELEDFKHMHERIVQHGETLKQLDPEAFKKLRYFKHLPPTRGTMQIRGLYIAFPGNREAWRSSGTVASRCRKLDPCTGI